MKTLCSVVVLLLASMCAHAQDASTAWRDVIKRCARTDLIGTQSLFFGVSNLIGPGSIWRRADDHSIRLVSVLSDAIPNTSDQSLIVKPNNVAACVGNSSSRWNLRLGLPFTTGATPLSLDIGALLGGAHDVTVSVQGYALDTLDEAQWKKAYASLGDGNAFYKEIFQPNRMLAENAVKVTGLTAVFNYKHDLSADVTAKYKGTSFTLGNSSSSKDGTTSSKAANNASDTSQKTSAGNTSKTTPPAPSNSAKSSACDSSATTTPSSSATPASGTSTGDQSASNSGTATLHVEFSGSRQIKICVDGPFYLLAAYSNIVNGAPVGLEATKLSVNDLVLTDATVPKDATLASDRKPE